MNRLVTLALSVATLLAATAWLGCADEEPEPNSGLQTTGGSGGTGGADAGLDGARDCYENPRTHLEIINACTKAVRVKKSPQLRLLGPDGSLPPL